MIQIGDRCIGSGHPAYIVAEVGQNHQGDVYTATRLFKMAVDAGVDAVKLCKRDIDSDLTREAQDAPYDGPQSFGRTYGMHRRALELSPDEYDHLADRIRYNEWPLTMFATACDIKSVDDIEASINPPMYKVASRDLDNLPLLDYIGRLGKPVIISGGMALDGDIEQALQTIRKYHNQIILCVCTSKYPTPNNCVGLYRIPQWREKYDVEIGMSDHTAGVTASIAAVALGACYVEKHITLSRAMRGTDHAASLEPTGLRYLVEKVRAVEEMFQVVDTAITETRRKLAKSLVTTRTIQQGEIVTESDLCLKSPATGIKWTARDIIVGKRMKVYIPADTTIMPDDVEASK